MKFDILQFIHHVRNSPAVAKKYDKEAYIFAVADMSAILKTIKQDKENFSIYSVWSLLGRMFIYTIIQDKANGLPAVQTLTNLSTLTDKSTDYDMIYNPSELIEENIMSTIHYKRICNGSFFEFCASINLTIADLRNYSTAILAINTVTSNVSDEIDELLASLIKIEETTTNEHGKTKRLDTRYIQNELQKEIEFKNIEKSQNNYSLF